MRVILQPLGSRLCGQACVAALLGLTLEEAVKLVGKRGSTHAKDLAPILRSRGFGCPDKLTLLRGSAELPGRCLVRCVWKSGMRHWMLRWDGRVYDPAYGLDHELRPGAESEYRITSFLPLKPPELS